MIHLIGNILIVICAGLATAICALYHLSARWWESEPGRHIMSFTAVIALLLWLWTIGAFFDRDATWFQALRLVAFFGLPWVLGWRLWLLYKIQIRPRRTRQ